MKNGPHATRPPRPLLTFFRLVTRRAAGIVPPMKILISLALTLTLFGSAAVRAAEGGVRAAVVLQSASAELRTVNPNRSTGRESLVPGVVYEVASKEGSPVALKIDANRVAVAPVGTVRVRTCTAAELSQAQAKFNALKPEAQRDAKKKITAARATAACATCPTVQASAQKNYATQSKALKDQKEALLKEALAWAAKS